MINFTDNFKLNFMYDLLVEFQITKKHIHLLWMLNFLSVYLPMDCHHCLWGVCKNTYNEWTWKLINFYNNYFNFRNNFKEIYWWGYKLVGIIDATELYVRRPMGYFSQNEIYSGYKKRHTWKYNMVIFIITNEIIFVDGPYPGKEDDVAMLKIEDSKILENMIGEQLLVADKKYHYCKRCLTGYDVPGKILLDFVTVRSKVEHKFGEMKTYQILAHTFRHSKTKHELVFKLVAHLVILKNKKNNQ
jgi:hypothetical protein